MSEKRVIKFRAWTKNDDGTWRGPWYGGFAIHATGKIVDQELIPEGDMDVEQFTGLKDKSTKEELYEGDIVIASWYWDKPHVLVWPDDYYSIIEFAIEDELTKLGNIHQSPELLK